MALVRILGAIDLISAFIFLMLAFGISPWMVLVFFCAGVLFVKGLFVFSGEPLSAIDLFSSLCLFLSIPFTLPTMFIWIPSFLLVAKGFVSLI